MKNWKKTAIMASVLVFVCAGVYLNWLYTQDEQVMSLADALDQQKILGDAALVLSEGADAALEAASEGSDTVTDYFAAVRLSRQQSRDSAIATLQETMAYGAEGENTQASGTLEDLVGTALCEAQIESLVIAKGYVDCVAYMNGNGISVAVAAPEDGLQAADVSLISDIILSQTDISLDNIRVIEVK